MSILISNCYQICNSPINFSKSKHLFSFPKDERFKRIYKLECDEIYNLPSTKSQKFSTFGIGHKTDFAIRKRSPDPTIYNLHSDFNSISNKGDVYSFGINRDFYKKVFMKGHEYPDFSIPGPGSYNTRKDPGQGKLKFSLRPRTTLNLALNESKKIPGPGAYHEVNGTTLKGFQFLSKFKSSKASVFHPPNSARFKEEISTAKKDPGPGAYDPSTNISPNGSYFIAKFKSSLCRTFCPSDQRPTSQPHIDTPGPGTYRYPSEFGHYKAQEKFVKQSEEAEKKRKRKAVKIKTLKHQRIASCKTLLSPYAMQNVKVISLHKV